MDLDGEEASSLSLKSRHLINCPSLKVLGTLNGPARDANGVALIN